MKKSHHIRSRMASKFFKAAKFSEGQERALNRLVTLNLSHTACPEQEASPAFAALIGKFGRWLRHQSHKAEARGLPGFGPPLYEAVIEAPNGIHHVHWMVYIPPELDKLFAKTLPKWLEKTAGAILRPSGAIDIKPIESIMGLSRYCMKGVERHHARRSHVRPSDQGIVFGKRVMISRSLGAAARAKAKRPIAVNNRATGSASPAGSAPAPDLLILPDLPGKHGDTGGMPLATPLAFQTPGVQLPNDASQGPPF